MFECLALIVVSNPKHSRLAEQVPLNLTLNSKPKPPSPEQHNLGEIYSKVIFF
jgi:hypothetical protein